MGMGLLRILLILSLFFNFSSSQESKTDVVLVTEFLSQMGLEEPNLNASSLVCSWPGVICNTTKEKSVVQLIASGLNLTGPIPENTIGKLRSLQVLDLSNNRIERFSSDFFLLRGGDLRILNFSSNRISGFLSDNISNFNVLQTLDLSRNNFSGEIPASIWSLSNLTILNLGDNKFKGTIPSSIFGCKCLVSLDLSKNQIDSLNSTSQFNCTNLVHLDLSENQISGVFFNNSISNSLRHLNLAHNRFSEQNFLRVEKFVNLEHLNLSQTNLTGDIPQNISRLKGLKVLDLSQNRLTGNIPALSTGKLEILDFSWNNLTGSIPSSLLDKLRRIPNYNFSHNNLTLCLTEFHPEIRETAFLGARNSCQSATNTNQFNVVGSSKHRTIWIVLSVVLSVIFILAVLVFVLFMIRKRRKIQVNNQSSYIKEGSSQTLELQLPTEWISEIKLTESVPVIIFEKPLLNLTFSDLLSATSYFGKQNIIGEGRYGTLYRGRLRERDKVLIQVLTCKSNLNDDEVLKELEYVGRLKHSNLVPVLGYCLAGNQRIIIYDYMENGTLQSLIHGAPMKSKMTGDWFHLVWEETNTIDRRVDLKHLENWRVRYKIALGLARALAFLHHGCFPQIIHGDVNPSNIYLDSSLEPRLSGFRLEKIVTENKEHEIVQDSTGYSPPELSQSKTSILSPSVDVYSFGVILLQLITGKKPFGDNYHGERDSNLVNWVRKMVKMNEATEIIDTDIQQTGSVTQMEEALRIGYLCTADSPTKRPSMQQIVNLLKDIGPDK